MRLPEGVVAWIYPRALFAGVIAGIVAVCYRLLELTLLAEGGFGGGDLLAFLQAAKLAATRGWNQIYLAQGAHPYFFSPPLVAWLAWPLTHFGGRVGALPAPFVEWTLMTVAALIAAWHLGAPGGRAARALWLLALFGSYPVAFALGEGQVIPLALFGLTVCWCLLDERPWLAGVALALALQLKPTVAGLAVPALLLAGGWRPVASWAVVTAACLVAYALVVGPAWPLQLLALTHAALAEPENGALAIGVVATVVAWIVTAAAVLLVAWRRDRELALAIGLPASLLVSPYIHSHDLMVGFIPFWVIQRRAGGWKAAACALPALVLGGAGRWEAIATWMLVPLFAIVWVALRESAASATPGSLAANSSSELSRRPSTV